MAKEIKILVADDEDLVRDLLSAKLREQGYLVYETANGEETLEVVKNEKPELVLLDVKMPKMDGLQVCHIIKNNDELKKIKVLIFTAKTELAERREAIQKGADYYLTKPARFSEILKLIEEMV